MKDNIENMIVEFLNGDIDPEKFCELFEDAFNFGGLDYRQRKLYGNLFDSVVMFSPISSDVEAIPNYIGPEELRNVVYGFAKENKLIDL